MGGHAAEIEFAPEEETRAFAQGDVIFKDGDPGDSMFGVQEGAVDLVVAGTVVETVGPGGIFGEMAIIEHAPRTATAIASKPSKIVVIDEARFAVLTQNAPEFALRLLRVISRRIRVMDKLVT
jgi:CRP-like cAMP-binding protein